MNNITIFHDCADFKKKMKRNDLQKKRWQMEQENFPFYIICAIKYTQYNFCISYIYNMAQIYKSIYKSFKLYRTTID